MSNIQFTDFVAYVPQTSQKTSTITLTTTTRKTLVTKTSTTSETSSSSAVRVTGIGFDGHATTIVGTQDHSSSTTSSHNIVSTVVEATASTSSSDYLTSGSSRSSSLTLGLVIGIPCGLLGLSLIVVGTWYYFRRKTATNNSILPMTSSFYETHPKGNSSEITIVSNANPYTQQRASVPDTTRHLNRLSSMLTPIRFKPGPKTDKAKPESMFLKRFSSQGRKDGIDVADYTISPLFPKRFNLNKPCTPETIPEAPEPVNYKQKRLPKLPTLINMERAMSVYEVVKRYQKSLNDEIDLKVGDRVEKIKSHSDGWCMIKQLTNGATGMVPELCLRLE
ncbi:fus1 actin binding protein [Yamadazyma tenuis]|uniref:SH3 domain-containing protein n=1 Tax=Candida tenuis (strain ATCC 10573 / BCRC 21748 / CBS 615 / JCM 9827 / NBRC 10315 / NRRL Y-1498 / VKM Y-70) TaxID=590646 RepID=G3B978_CANTC|nr:uncharacterized protein CANTEDRAFT_94712 [Yamadazyma tenuis ATCC 10573]EGV61833.1 hypothetical protein CANTEDRAFT_94712 [Yamadazyma tenuis ATCC 10573]WEJ93058.1 fus1 actin binding protein [Yamadazyma tenuis]